MLRIFFQSEFQWKPSENGLMKESLSCATVLWCL